jgi:uncharacterized protein YdhG (YjbR/CyaY superfamily)
MRPGRKYPVHKRLPGLVPEKFHAVPECSGGTIAMRDKFATIDEYIASFPPEIREILEKIRSTIRKTVPDATEAIAYGIPTFRLNGNLVHFAAFKNHIGFFPTSSGIAAFRNELSSYTTSKGTVQFPLDMPIPYDLVEAITVYRAAENRKKKT